MSWAGVLASIQDSSSSQQQLIPGAPQQVQVIPRGIPVTSFRCAEQQYSGIFADTDTGCQVRQV